MERVDALGELEIQFGQTRFAVGVDAQLDVVAFDLDVRMMFLFLGNLGDEIDEIDGANKIVELEKTFDLLFVRLPLGHFFEEILEVCGGDQVGHILKDCVVEINERLPGRWGVNRPVNTIAPPDFKSQGAFYSNQVLLDAQVHP